MRLQPDVPTDPGRYAFVHRLRVRFAETDAMGVAHHASYLPYLEEARVEYLRSVGHPYDVLRGEGVDLAVVEAAVSYHKPLRFDDPVDVHLKLSWARGAACQIDYLLTVDGALRATAATVHGATAPSGRPVRLPSWLVAVANS